MKVKYSKPKRQRIKISYSRPLWIEPEDRGLDFDITEKKWVKEVPKGNGLTTAYYAMGYHGLRDVYSIKAAIRLVNSWDVPVGTKFYVGLPWVGHHVIVTKTERRN